MAMISSVSVDSGKKKTGKGSKSSSPAKKLPTKHTKKSVKTGASTALSSRKKKKIAFDGDSFGSSHDAIIDKEGTIQGEEGSNTKSGKRRLNTTPLPRTSVRALKKQMQKQREEDSEEDEDETSNRMMLLEKLMDDEKEDLHDVLLSSSEEDDEDAEVSDRKENEFEKSHREGTKLSYLAIRFRFLPPEFEEPQLFKFLNQFGATVLNCFCVRSKRTFQSLGIAYAHFSNPDVLPLVKEECDGMLLGSRTVRARIVTLHRPMPKKEAVTKRRLLGRAYRDKGPPLHQFVSSYKKNEIAALIKATRSEVRNNHLLKAMGIDFRSTAFADQLAAVPKALLLGKKQAMVNSLLQLAKENATLSEKQAETMKNVKGGSADEATPSSASNDDLKRRTALIRQALGRGTGRRKRGGSKDTKQTSGKSTERRRGSKQETHEDVTSRSIRSKKSETKSIKDKKVKKVRRSLKKKNRSKVENS